MSVDGADKPLDRVVDALLRIVGEAGGTDRVIRPLGYDHMGLVVLDSIYSLRANYDTIVIPLIGRVRDMVGPELIGGSGSLVREFDAHRLKEWIESLTASERKLILNNQKSPGTSILKSQTCVEVADVLIKEKTAMRQEFCARCEKEHQKDGRGTLGAAIRSVRGVGPAAWRYMINLVGLQSVKPDTMVMRWLERVTGEIHSPDQAAELVERASGVLLERGLDMDARTTDHLIWRVESGRPISGGGVDH